MSENSCSKINIFLIDDHPAVLRGLSLLLNQNGLHVCGEAQTREQTLLRVAEAHPDLVLLDVSLENEDGFDILVELYSRGFRTLVYSMHDDALSIKQAFTSGALGYVAKCEKVVTLLEGIRVVNSGRNYLSSTLAQILADRHVFGTDWFLANRLSAREYEVFTRLGEGDHIDDIALSLGIATTTVGTHFARITEKMGYSGIKEMRRKAIKFIKTCRQSRPA